VRGASLAPLLVWAALLLVVGWVVVTGCSSTPEQRRALSVAHCIAGIAEQLPPPSPLPESAPELTNEDLEVALVLIRGVRKCRELAHAADAGG
jgi:hypothetical protein